MGVDIPGEPLPDFGADGEDAEEEEAEEEHQHQVPQHQQHSRWAAAVEVLPPRRFGWSHLPRPEVFASVAHSGGKEAICLLMCWLKTLGKELHLALRFSSTKTASNLHLWPTLMMRHQATCL